MVDHKPLRSDPMDRAVQQTPDISVVVPVYNSQGTLRALIGRLLETFASMGVSGEVIFVDDGSADASWDVLQTITAEHPEHVTAIQLMRNFGQHNALMCGFHHVRGKVVVTLDDDLQNPPEEIPKLIECLNAGAYDLVYGNYAQKKHAKWRNIGSRTIQYFFSLVFDIDVAPTSFRAFRSALLPSLLSYQLNYTFIDGLLNWCTRRIGSVEVAHHERQSGASGYRLKTLLLLALNLFTNFSIIPLQIVSLCGLATAALGFLGAFYYLVLFVVAQIAVPGFATIVILLLVLGGLQMLALGVIGEYLGRIHLNINRKPQYLIREYGVQNKVPAGQVLQEVKDP